MYIGTAFMKTGFAGEDSPGAVFPTLVGRSTVQSKMIAKQPVYIGESQQSLPRIDSLLVIIIVIIIGVIIIFIIIVIIIGVVFLLLLEDQQ